MKIAVTIKIIIMLLGVFSLASAADITGLITDSKTGEPLPGVHVAIKDTDLGTATDQNGIYEIKNLSEGDYKIEFRVIGYDRYKTKITLPDVQLFKLDIQLDQLP